MIMMIKKKNVQDICSMQTRCYAFYIHDVTQSSKPVVPNLFGTRDWFFWRQIFYSLGAEWGMVWGWFKGITFTAHFIVFLLLLYQLLLKSSGIRSQSLGTPALKDQNGNDKARVSFLSFKQICFSVQKKKYHFLNLWNQNKFLLTLKIGTVSIRENSWWT